MAGLEPRGFKWVIAGRLAISERIGGYGFQHRRVRREEEIIWLAEQGVNSVVSLMAGNQNQAAYEGATLAFYHYPIEDDLDPAEVDRVFGVLDDAMNAPGASVLVHRELIGDLLVGLMGGYLVHSGLVKDPIVATSIIQEISGRPLGPEGRGLIPDAE
ncbi:MAG: hypothetical protein GY788_30820 [bacterium]|nr:hypothetical protein [bacterium]